jgi:signal transduction histidine kinase
MLVFFAVAVALISLFLFARQALFASARSEVEQLASAAAAQVDVSLHQQMTGPELAGTQAHLRALAPLVTFHKATRNLMYVYTVVLRNDKPYFVLGTDYLYRVKGDELPPDAIMQPYLGNDPNLARALREGRLLSNASLVHEKHRSYLSAYAPFFDAKGTLVGVLGVDMWARDVEMRQQRLDIGFLMLMLLNGLSAWLIASVLRALQRREHAQHQLHENLELARDAGDRASNAAALAAVVAHEFSQHLTVASGHMEMARNNVDEAAAAQLTHAQNALTHAADAVDQMRTLAGNNFSTLDSMRLTDLLRRALDRLQRRGLETSRVVVPDMSVTSAALVDATRVTAALAHLIRNALEARPDTPVRIEILPSAMTGSEWHNVYGASPPQSVAILISDFGQKLTPELLQKFGTPFYSSKGLGYGLGLAVVKGALASMPGALQIGRKADRTLTQLILQAA